MIRTSPPLSASDPKSSISESGFLITRSMRRHRPGTERAVEALLSKPAARLGFDGDRDFLRGHHSTHFVDLLVDDFLDLRRAQRTEGDDRVQAIAELRGKRPFEGAPRDDPPFPCSANPRRRSDKSRRPRSSS